MEKWKEKNGKVLRHCSKKLMFQIVSKSNSEKKRILNDVVHHKNFLYTFYFDESKKLLDYVNVKQLKVFQTAKFLYDPKAFGLF